MSERLGSESLRWRPQGTWIPLLPFKAFSSSRRAWLGVEEEAGTPLRGTVFGPTPPMTLPRMPRPLREHLKTRPHPGGVGGGGDAGHLLCRGSVCEAMAGSARSGVRLPAACAPVGRAAPRCAPKSSSKEMVKTRRPAEGGGGTEAQRSANWRGPASAPQTRGSWEGPAGCHRMS